MRITDAMSLNNVLESEANASQRLNQLTEMASSGLRVSEPSDDPAAYASIVQQDASISTMQARSTAVNTAASNLNLAGDVLDQATDLFAKARAIAVEQSNGTQSATSNAAAAQEVNSLTQQLLALANSQGTSGYLFGGTNTATPPFDSSGNYQGNSGVTHVEVAQGVLAVSNADGAQAFTTAGGRNVFADLQTLSTALSNNDPAAIQASITSIDAASAQVTAAQVSTGEAADRLQSASTAMSTAVTQMQGSVGSLADADMASTASNLEETQTAYQAALQVNKQILSLASAESGG
jgi:flagellar hook-associated protein 3 FlgL